MKSPGKNRRAWQADPGVLGEPLARLHAALCWPACMLPCAGPLACLPARPFASSHGCSRASTLARLFACLALQARKNTRKASQTI